MLFQQYGAWCPGGMPHHGTGRCLLSPMEQAAQQETCVQHSNSYIRCIAAELSMAVLQLALSWNFCTICMKALQAASLQHMHVEGLQQSKLLLKAQQARPAQRARDEWTGLHVGPTRSGIRRNWTAPPRMGGINGRGRHRHARHQHAMHQHRPVQQQNPSARFPTSFNGKDCRLCQHSPHRAVDCCR